MTGDEGSVTALLLAGRREGRLDPLAAEAGMSHKCLVPVGGRPMILHVLDALASAPEIGRVLVSVDDPSALERLPEVRQLRAAGRLVIVSARPRLVDSILAAAEHATFPLLVTTADNVLLTPDAIAEFIYRVGAADAGVAFTRRSSVLAAHPDGQRRFYTFSDDSYSNCNIYWVGQRQSLEAAQIFRSGGQFAKHPLRIVAVFGLVNLIRFHFGLGTLAGAFARFSRRFGLSIRGVILSDGAVAIDVDNARTLGVAEAILQKRSQRIRESAWRPRGREASAPPARQQVPM